MNKRLTYIFFISTSVLLCFGCKTTYAPVIPVIQLETSLDYFHLYGPVKSVRAFETFHKNNLSLDSINFYKSNIGVDLRLGYGLHFFDRNGMITRIQRLVDNINYTVADTSYKKRVELSESYYDNAQYKIKMELSSKDTLPPFFYNPLLLKIEQGDQPAYNRVVLKRNHVPSGAYITRYVFEDQKIKTESRIGIIDTKGKKREKELIKHIFYYNYDTNERLISKKFEFKLKFSDTSPVDHDVWVSPHTEPWEYYTYDDIGNLSGVYLYASSAKEKLLFMEEYNYSDTNKLIKVKRQSSSDAMAFNTYMRKTNELFLNDKGLVEKVIAYNDDGTIQTTRFYEYGGWDNYGNWTYCHKHLEGKITKKPTMTINKIIEYYEE